MKWFWRAGPTTICRGAADPGLITCIQSRGPDEGNPDVSQPQQSPLKNLHYCAHPTPHHTSSLRAIPTVQTGSNASKSHHRVPLHVKPQHVGPHTRTPLHQESTAEITYHFLL
ncbi:hypothetical protein VNO80_22058 [Phaseolus coccineus]|uniref:Uncharacterized protein n=1 Tax=Phaseolus coccineus TaxID=3886 RepID=A0AAN9QUK1_PHACN